MQKFTSAQHLAKRKHSEARVLVWGDQKTNQPEGPVWDHICSAAIRFVGAAGWRTARSLWFYYPDQNPLLDNRGEPAGYSRTHGDMRRYAELTDAHQRTREGCCTIQDLENYFTSTMGLGPA